MNFVKIINNKKFTLISVFLLLYFLLNFIDGERGLLSYIENKKIKKQLVAEKEFLNKKLNKIETFNQLLKEPVDLDYLEIIYREKFMVGRSEEKIYKVN